ncbi:MAG: hypothetical protein KAX13_10340, partial [Candidatus Krumholzibacteria bacterium]|nr:hypothetical protein [Candidatus Krumholzibacteria bacterium]
IFLILREVRGRRISAELGRILESESATVVLLAALAVVISRFYLAPGQFALGDALCHTSRVWAAARSLESGHWPSWSFLNYCGFPLLQFYGPLFFVLAGALSNLIGSTQAATKTLIFIFHAGSAFPLYFWSRAIGASRRASLIAAVAYIISFQHTYAVTWGGFLPVSLVYLLFPLLLLGTEKVLSISARRWIFVVAGAMAALILCHQQYAAFSMQLIALYVLVRWILPGTERPGFRQVASVVLSLCAGVLLCALFLVPSLAEKEWVYFPGWLPLLRFGVPSTEFLKKVFVWRNVWSGWNYAYLGITIVVCAILGSWSAWRRNASERADYISRSIVIVAVIAFLSASQVGRLMHVVLPFIALLCGAVMRLDTKASPPRFALFVIALLFLDLGPTTIQSPYRTDREFLRDGLRKAADLINPHRTLLGYTSDYGTHFSAWAYTEDSDLIIPVGSFPQGAPRSLNGVTVMTDALNIHVDSLAAVRLDFLYLWDVAGLVTNRRDRFVPPAVEGLKVRGTDPPIAWLDSASPLVFSKCLAIAEDDSLYDLNQVNLVLKGDHTIPERQSYIRRMALWVTGMGIERSQRQANCIFLANGEGARGLELGILNSDMTLPRLDNPKYLSNSITKELLIFDTSNNNVKMLTINDFRVDLRNVKISYSAATKGYLRLAFSWYPTIRVLVDREPVAPLRSLFGAIIIPTGAGDHTIELSPHRFRGYLFHICVLTVMGILILFVAFKFVQR